VALARVADVPRPLTGHGYLVTRPEQLATLGDVWESSLFPGRAPDGYALLRVFLGGARRPDVLSLDQRAAAVLAREELARVIGITAAPARTWAFHWPNAIAQYTVGHAARVAAIHNALVPHEGLSVAGTSYDGVSFNHAIAAGRKAARTLLADLAAVAATRTHPGATPAASVTHVVLVTMATGKSGVCRAAAHSWRILLGLTRPLRRSKPVLPIVAVSRARSRHRCGPPRANASRAHHPGPG
jgi:hypothetical protein